MGASPCFRSRDVRQGFNRSISQAGQVGWRPYPASELGRSDRDSIAASARRDRLGAPGLARAGWLAALRIRSRNESRLGPVRCGWGLPPVIVALPADPLQRCQCCTAKQTCSGSRNVECNCSRNLPSGRCRLAMALALLTVALPISHILTTRLAVNEGNTADPPEQMGGIWIELGI